MKLFKDKLLLLISLLSIYSLLLVAIRIKITNSFFYLFLVWNIFLAFIPFGISTILKNSIWLQKSNFRFWSLLLIWLLFLPNAPYILTDLFHLKLGRSMPQWYDLLLISSFAANGLLLFFISINDIHQLIKNKLSNFKAWTITITVFFLSSFGIYLGRFLRWNSWDIIQKPQNLFYDIIIRLSNPIQHPKTWGVTLGFGLFFMINFLIFKTIISNKRITNDV